jgi:hypothetical protein
MIKRITKKEEKELKEKAKQEKILNPFEDLEAQMNELEEDFNNTVRDFNEEADKVTEDVIEFDIELLVDKILKFGLLLSDTSLYDYQIEPAKGLIRDVLTSNGSRITILFPRQSGKTEIFKVVVPSCSVLLPKLYNMFPKELSAFKDGFYAGIFALSKETSSTMYGRIVDVFRSSHAKVFLEDPDLDIAVKKTNPLKLSNGSKVHSHSMLAKILVSYSYHIMIVDEADKALNTHRLTTDIQPMGAAYNGTFVMLGTAGDQPCLFYEYIRQNKELYDRTEDKKHYQIDYKTAMRVNPLYARYMEGVLNDLESGAITKKSFDMSYGLKWFIDDNKFMPRTRLAGLLDSNGKLYHDGKSDEIKRYELVGGLDLAKKLDRTVLTLMRLEPIEGSERYYRRVVSWFELNKMKWGNQRRALFEFITRFNLSTIYGDATGVGDVFIDELTEDLEDFYVEIVPMVFSDKSKAQGYTRLDGAIDRGEIIIPSSYEVKQTKEYKNFVEDLTNCQWVAKKNYSLVEALPQKHDDYADSLMLANLAAESLIEVGNFEIVSNDLWGRFDTGWDSV